MEIILTDQCKSLTGSLGAGFGYHIQRRKNGFFAKRNSKSYVPMDGHWRFIIACAKMAQKALHIADIRVSYTEFYDAVREAGMVHKIPAYFGWDGDIFMNAKQVLDFAEEYKLEEVLK